MVHLEDAVQAVHAADQQEDALSSDMQQIIRDLAPDSVWFSEPQLGEGTEEPEASSVVHACFTPGEPGLRRGTINDLLDFSLAQKCKIRWRYVCEQGEDVRPCVWSVGLVARAAMSCSSPA